MKRLRPKPIIHTSPNLIEQLKAIKDKKYLANWEIGQALKVHPATVMHWLHGKYKPDAGSRSKIQIFLNKQK